VAFFLGDANFLSDPKFRALARRLSDVNDFNSAVGAYWIALAAARRNGLPTISVVAETESRFVDDLEAVGLLTAEGFPVTAFRDWAPSRRPRPSESSVSNGVEVVESDTSAASSTPLPSITLLSTSTTSSPSGGGVGEGLPHLNSTVARIWEDATGRTILASGDYVLNYLDDACRRHPPYEVGAAITRARKAFEFIPDGPPLVAEVRRLLDPFTNGKELAKAEREEEIEVSSKRRVEATLAANHKTGWHDAAPDTRCPLCPQ